ncbi:hypothetical protein GGX14DRAFT_399003 [Mycena pura]|uniref:Uncharacterized protein n=1 Tax=Mycena pura TaxID=153505 RepID=A0AAD6YCX1_9AGAR|nr:hypothetical protein GGX14DRAFT_399003 [Mycena pura]
MMRISRAVEPSLALSPRKQQGRGQSCTLYAGMASQRRGVRGDGRGAMGGLPREALACLQGQTVLLMLSRPAVAAGGDALFSRERASRRRVGAALDVDVPVLVFLLLRPLRALTLLRSDVPRHYARATAHRDGLWRAYLPFPSFHILSSWLPSLCALCHALAALLAVLAALLDRVDAVLAGATAAGNGGGACALAGGTAPRRRRQRAVAVAVTGAAAGYGGGGGGGGGGGSGTREAVDRILAVTVPNPTATTIGTIGFH